MIPDFSLVHGWRTLPTAERVFKTVHFRRISSSGMFFAGERVDQGNVVVGVDGKCKENNEGGFPSQVVLRTAKGRERNG